MNIMSVLTMNEKLTCYACILEVLSEFQMVKKVFEVVEVCGV